MVEPEDALEFVRIINENMNASKNMTNNDKFLINLAHDLNFIGVFGL